MQQGSSKAMSLWKTEQRAWIRLQRERIVDIRQKKKEHREAGRRNKKMAELHQREEKAALAQLRQAERDLAAA